MSIEDKIEQPKAEKKISLGRKIGVVALAVGLTGIATCSSKLMQGMHRYNYMRQICTDLYSQSIKTPIEGNIEHIKYKITSTGNTMALVIKNGEVQFAFFDVEHDAVPEIFVRYLPIETSPRPPNLEEISAYNGIMEQIAKNLKKKTGVPV